jgi:hypothetical protein
MLVTITRPHSVRIVSTGGVQLQQQQKEGCMIRICFANDQYGQGCKFANKNVFMHY